MLYSPGEVDQRDISITSCVTDEERTGSWTERRVQRLHSVADR